MARVGSERHSKTKFNVDLLKIRLQRFLINVSIADKRYIAILYKFTGYQLYRT